ncbi:MAG: hypothetical protein IJ040_07495 [Lachnospiraceae bacterium]|nr:hypothetical protein [Lachnospiraceae bacterium]
MLYKFSEGLTEIAINELTEYDFMKNELIAGSLNVEVLKASYEALGIPEGVVTECLTESRNYRNTIEVQTDYCFGILNIIDQEDIYSPRDRVALILKKNLFLIVIIRDEDHSIDEVLQGAMQRFSPEVMTLEKLIYGFLEGTVAMDSKLLEQKEFIIEAMEEDIHDGEIEREFIGSILGFKKEVTILRNYYEQLLEISELLTENENQMFCNTELRYFQLFAAKVERLRNYCLELKENLVQVREAYSSTLDYSINSVMKMFTVVTTIFQPLTLITGWYGMNFTGMPELTWRYGYLMVILLSVVVVCFCLWWFRRKRLL